MKITVAICTWNRARLLDQTLESLSKMDVPRGLDWELVVVDNNSTELAVPLVLNGWRQQLPLVTAIEEQQGHSAARNRAVELATGDYLVWTDNDVRVSPQWLAAYADAFRKYPDVAFFGGEIKPVFEEGKPDWMESTWSICAPVYATRDLGNELLELDETKLPYGANFAIRADFQRRFPYDTQWGRKTTSMVGEDEIAVLTAVARAGGKGLWLPDARLEHVIPADRANESYVGAYYFGQGLTNALKGKIERGRFRIWWEALVSLWKYRLQRRFTSPQAWVSFLAHARIRQGELAGLKQLRQNQADHGSHGAAR